MPSESIIVIDSEPIVRNVITEILCRAGYQIQATGDPQTATQMVRHTRPDLVITNVFLKGLRSHDVMQQLRSEFPIFVSCWFPDSRTMKSSEPGRTRTDLMRSRSHSRLTP